MDKKDNILNQAGKDPGFSVPEHYFEDFAAKVVKEMPELEFEKRKLDAPSRWLMMRPYVYMAAMFLGIMCMVRIFNDFKNSDLKTTTQNVLTSEDSLDEYIYYTAMNDFAVYEYIKGDDTDE